LLAELMQRLGVAECLQWRLRRKPLGVEDWRQIAGEDTGVMFETCARLGTRDDRLRKFGYLLGTLYHGCDDVADVRGATALGGGKKEDVVDGILTLPAAIATRDLNTALLFRNASPENAAEITEQLMLALPEAESYLDKIAGGPSYARPVSSLTEVKHSTHRSICGSQWILALSTKEKNSLVVIES